MGEIMDNLFTNFHKSSKEEWAGKATADLKGEDVFEKYSWRFEEGIDLAPYYDKSDLENIKNLQAFQNRLIRKDNPTGEVRYWENLQQVLVVVASAANQQALQALNNGADGIIFDLRQVGEGFNFDDLLEHILIDYCHISFVLGSTPKDHLVAYLDYVTNKQLDPQALKGMIKLTDNPEEHWIDAFKTAINYPGIKTFVLNGEGHGASDEIANVLLQGTSAINTMLAAKFDIEQIVDKVMIIVNLSTDYFGSIAKIRATRNLFFQLARAYGYDSFNPEDLHIHAVSPAWINEKYQPNSNMLKSTTAAMAAILGGCDSLVIEPEDYNSTVMVRTARNVSSVLKEESYFNKTTDPVAGTYYIEALTQQLSQKAWKKFQMKVTENSPVSKSAL